MTLLLSNILPSNHYSDLLLSKCQLVYATLTQVSVHVAQLISNAMYQFARITPLRHPVDPGEIQQGPSISCSDYMAFIEKYCMPNKLIRPPINRAFIEKYCMPRQM
ncbi:hypothetical protein HKD37_U058975 [Glycine soja]